MMFNVWYVLMWVLLIVGFIILCVKGDTSAGLALGITMCAIGTLLAIWWMWAAMSVKHMKEGEQIVITKTNGVVTEQKTVPSQQTTTTVVST